MNGIRSSIKLLGWKWRSAYHTKPGRKSKCFQTQLLLTGPATEVKKLTGGIEPKVSISAVRLPKNFKPGLASFSCTLNGAETILAVNPETGIGDIFSVR